MALTAGVLKLLPGLPKAYLQYVVYSKDTVQVQTGAIGLGKAALTSWQELALHITSPVDGYLQVVFVNESAQPVYVDDFFVTNSGKEYKGGIVGHLALNAYGECMSVCGHVERTYLSTEGTCKLYRVCYQTVDCNTGRFISNDGCDTVCEDVENPTPDPENPTPNPGEPTPPGGDSPPTPPPTCPGGGYVDDCGVCVGGDTGLTPTTYYQDLDGDGWGTTSVTMRCATQPYSGTWAVKLGDYDDYCYNLNNDSNQCTCANPSPAKAFLGRTYFNFRNPVSAYPNRYGYTDTEAIEIAIRACRSNGRWHAKLHAVTGYYSIQTRLLPGMEEVTGPFGNTTLANFCDQKRDLRLTTMYAQHWYMLSAVEAHENVHATRLEPALTNVLPTIQQTIESLSVLDTGQSEQDAINELTINYLYKGSTIIESAFNSWYAELLRLVAYDHNNGTGPTYSAEHAVTEPMITTICGQFPCTICP